MKRLKNKSLGSVLESTLVKAKLPLDPSEVVGGLYRFEYEGGSHHIVLCGTIQAIELSDEGGLTLYVSNPRFWGCQLLGIKYSGRRWMAKVQTDQTDSKSIEYFTGIFTLYHTM